MPFTVATYNVLATGFIRRKFYPRTPPELLSPTWRLPALGRHVRALDADVVCLQEVEPEAFAAIDAALAPGYRGHYAPRKGRKPDGCAAFVRRPIDLQQAERLAFSDGSGHIAQLLRLSIDGRALGIANTHLKWSPADVPLPEQPPMLEVEELLRMIAARPADAWILCGDLNMTPDTDVMAAVRRAGFSAAHRDVVPGYTCNPNGRAKTIDYLFHSVDLRAIPAPLPVIDDATPLPSPEQPSDHLALMAAFDWI